MITGLYLHEDGHRIGIELGDGDDGLMVVDIAFDPPLTTDVPALEGDGWTEQAARTFGDS